MKAIELFENTELQWNKNPQIGWWLDNDPVTFYHGTHMRNIEGILKHGIFAPSEGPTAGKVSLALDPYTAFGYAAMGGDGGESSFRGAGQKAKTTPPSDRVVFVLEIPQNYFLPRMVDARSSMTDQAGKLDDRREYENFKRTAIAPNNTDHLYYALTEIRLPEHVPAEFIKGYMFKK